MSQDYSKFHQTFDDMIESARAVRGEAFAKLVMQIINQKAIIKMVDVIAHMSAEAGETILADKDQPFTEMLAVILRQNISMMTDVLELNHEMLKEALEFADRLTDQGENIAKDMADKEAGDDA